MKAALMLLAALFSLTGARAETSAKLTIYDGNSSTNTNVPVSGSNVKNNFSKSQFIIPATKLTAMAGGDITVMTFYANDEQANWGPDAKFDVYLYEVSTSTTTLSSLQQWSTLTKVYSGRLAVSAYQMTIRLDNPFTYSGNKNLLVGINQTANGTNETYNATSTWKGETANNGTSMGGYGSSASAYTGNNISRQRFIPQITFTYIPGYTPTNVTINQITATTANVNWNGTADSYVVKYRTKRTGFSETFENGWGNWKRITAGQGPGWAIETQNNTKMACAYSWKQAAGNNGYNANNWLISPAVDLGGILRFNVLTSVWHDNYEVKLCTTSIADVTANNVESKFTETLQAMAPSVNGLVDIDLDAYQGQSGYIAIHHVHNNGHFLDIDDFNVSAGHNWTTVAFTPTGTGNSHSVVLEGLVPETEYEIIIVGKKSGLTDALSSNETFTTGAMAVGTNIPVTIGSLGYSSLYYGTLNLTIPNGVTAYTYKVDNKLRVSKTYEAGQILPAGTAVVLKANKGTYNFVYTKTNGTADADNMLKGSDELETTTGGTYYYALSHKGGKNVGFYWMDEDGKAFDCPAHKAYLPLDKTFAELAGSTAPVTGVKDFSLFDDEDDPTGIENVNVNVNESIYNLAGQRLGKAQKGINIINGKKVLK